MSKMKKWGVVAATGALTAMLLPTVSYAASPGVSSQSSMVRAAVAQDVTQKVLSEANYFGDTDPSTPVTVDIVMKLQNQPQLSQYINSVSKPGPLFRKYMNTQQFASQYAPNPIVIAAVRAYFSAFGIQTSAYSDNLVITMNGPWVSLIKHLALH